MGMLVYPRDGQGRPVMPVDGSGNRVYAVDGRGNPILPENTPVDVSVMEGAQISTFNVQIGQNTQNQ